MRWFGSLLQTEPRAAHAKRPDLGVLAVRTLRSRGHLGGHQLGNPRVRPGERPVLIPRHGERLVPPVVAGQVAVYAQQEVEEAAVAEEAISADRIRLEAPRLDPVGRPPRQRVASL